MKGKNKLILNVSTMIEIVQHWLDTKAGALTSNVTGVSAGPHDTFQIELSDTPVDS